MFVNTFFTFICRGLENTCRSYVLVAFDKKSLDQTVFLIRRSPWPHKATKHHLTPAELCILSFFSNKKRTSHKMMPLCCCERAIKRCANVVERIKIASSALLLRENKNKVLFLMLFLPKFCLLLLQKFLS